MLVSVHVNIHHMFSFFSPVDGGIFARYYSNVYQTAVVESSTYIFVYRYFLCMLPGMFMFHMFQHSCSRELKPPATHTTSIPVPNPESLGGPKFLLGLWRNPGVLFGIFRVWPQHKGSVIPEKVPVILSRSKVYFRSLGGGNSRNFYSYTPEN